MWLPASAALAADAAVSTEVPAGQARTMRLRNVPAGALITLRLVTNGRILVSLVGARQLKEPRPDAKPLFRGVAHGKLAFRVTAREADDYVVVLSNRAGQQPVGVEAQVRVVARTPKPPRSPSELRAAFHPGRNAVARVGQQQAHAEGSARGVDGKVDHVDVRGVRSADRLLG